MRLPVTPQISTKNGAANQNGRMTNMLREKAKAVIRPGLSAVLDYAGLGAGLIPFNGRLIALFDDTIYAANDVGAALNVYFPLGANEFDPAATYDIGDIVWYTGQLWFSIVNNNPDAPPTNWDPSYPPPWNSEYTYPIDATVEYQDYIWRSLIGENIGNTPEVGLEWESDNPPPVVYEFTLTSGFYDNGGGDHTYGYEMGNFGALDPTTLFGGTFIDLVTAFVAGTYTTVLVLTGVHAQGAFTSLVANSITVLSANASYSNPGGTWTMWIWGGVNMLTAETNYSVTIT
jgi:hypothetical protein